MASKLALDGEEDSAERLLLDAMELKPRFGAEDLRDLCAQWPQHAARLSSVHAEPVVMRTHLAEIAEGRIQFPGHPSVCCAAT